MSRYYSPNITKEEFLEKIKKIAIHFDENYELPKKVDTDLAKVVFDWENHTLHFDEETGKFDEDNFSNYPVGYQEIGPRFHVFFVNAGGDWEYPICFILYWSGSAIRAYIPTEGNAFNKKYKTAYGSEDNNKAGLDFDDENSDIDHDEEVSEDRIITDIKERIKLK